jgi:hypothetical protein
MRGTKICILFIFLFVLSSGVIYSQTSDELAKAGTVGAQFLKFPVTARGAALGNGLVVKVNDASAIFCNPAGLAAATGISAFYSHTMLYFDMNLDAASVIYNVPRVGNFGINFIYFSSGDIEETTVEQQDGTGNMFQYIDYALGVSYARRITNRFNFGLNFKYAHEDLASGLGSGDEFKAGNLAIDVGLAYHTDFKGLSIGMNIKNFGPELQPKGIYQDWDNGVPIMDPDDPTKIEENEYRKYHMPLTFQVGVGIEPYSVGPHKLTIYTVLEHPNDNVEILNLAGEYLLDIASIKLAIRAGYSLGHDVKGITIGGGIMLKGLQIDYSLVDYGLLEYVNTFSITFNR